MCGGKKEKKSHKQILLFESFRVMATACWRMNGVINSPNVNLCVCVCVCALVYKEQLLKLEIGLNDVMRLR